MNRALLMWLADGMFYAGVISVVGLAAFWIGLHSEQCGDRLVWRGQCAMEAGR